MMAPSNRNRVEALAEISDITVKLSDEDLERMESLAEQITSFDPELGDRILDAYVLLSRLNDDLESALERLEPDPEDMEEKDVEIIEIEAHEGHAEDQEGEGRKQGKGRPNRQ
jgi:hypothetical protein